MEKKARITLKNNDVENVLETNIEITNDKINYIDSDSTNVLIYLNEKILVRENKEILLELDFNKEIGNLFVKDIKKNVNIKLKLNKINISDNNLFIDYNIEDDNFKFSMEWGM